MDVVVLDADGALGTGGRRFADGRRPAGRSPFGGDCRRVALVCQNESLASSNAELAEDLRREVRKLIRDNKSDTEIKTYLVERYGDFVLYRPQVKPLTWPLWFGPFFMLLLAIWGLWRYLRLRKNALAMQHASPTDSFDTAAHKD